MLYQNFYQGVIGTTVTQAYLNNTRANKQINWYTVPVSMFQNGESDVANAVLNHDYWAAVSGEVFCLLSVSLF